jgi:hypothetical protein
VNADHITSADWKNEDDEWASFGTDDNDNENNNGANTAPNANFPLLDDIAVESCHSTLRPMKTTRKQPFSTTNCLFNCWKTAFQTWILTWK